MDYLTLIATNTRILICIKILWSVDCELWTIIFFLIFTTCHSDITQARFS
jgi:hypothetical protein